MNEDFEKTINLIIKTSKNIKDIYILLAKLEKNNKKNSKDYNKLIRYLKIMREVEDIYYQKLDKSIKTYYDFIFFCEQDLVNVDELDSNIKERITNHLIYRSEKATDEESINFYHEYYNSQLKKISINKKDFSIDKMSMIEKNIFESIINTYLCFIEKKSKKNIKLIEKKYEVFNKHKNEELYLLKEEYNNDNIYYFDIETKAKILNIEKNIYEKYQNNVLQLEFLNVINKLLSAEKRLNITDKESIECYLRSIFTYVGKEIIDELNELFHNIIDEQKFNKNNINIIEENIELIINAFKKVRKDRNKVKILTIK